MAKSLDKFVGLILKLALPATAFLVPLYVFPFTTDPFGINKQFLLALIASITLVAWLLKNLLNRQVQFSVTPATLPLFLLALTFVVSSVLQSSTPNLSLIGKTTLIASLFIIFFTTTSTEKNDNIAKLTIVALFASVAIAAVQSLVSLTGSLSTSLPSWASDKGFNLTGGLIPALSIAAILIPSGLYLAITGKKPLEKVYFGGISALLVIASIAQINYLIGLKPSPIIVLPLSAGWAITMDVLKYWRTALIGTGPDTFLNTFTHFKPLFLNQTAVWNIRFSSNTNEILDIMSSVGLLGTIFLLAAIYRSLRPSLGKANPVFVLVLLCSLVFFFIPSSITLYAVFALGLSLLNLSYKNNHRLVKNVSLAIESESQVSAGSFFFPVVLMVILLPLVTIFWIFEGRSLKANIIAKQAADLIQTNSTQSYNLQIKAYETDPYNSSYRVMFAQTSLGLANAVSQQKNLTDNDKQQVTQLIQQAIREGKNATTIDPDNVTTWENLAQIYYSLASYIQGSSDWAIAGYSQAITLDPNNPLLRLQLGSVFYSLKDYDKAQRSFEQAISLKPDLANSHYNLAQTLKEKKSYADALAEMKTVAQLIDSKSDDAKKVATEITDLEKLAPTPTPTPAPSPTPTPSATPTPGK